MPKAPPSGAPEAPKRKVGRRPKLDAERTQALLGLLRAGCDVRHAVMQIGIGERTFYRWMELGERKARPEFWQFRQSVERAQAEAINSAIVDIMTIATGNRQKRLKGYRGKSLNPSVMERFTALKFIVQKRAPNEWGDSPKGDDDARGGQANGGGGFARPVINIIYDQDVRRPADLPAEQAAKPHPPDDSEG